MKPYPIQIAPSEEPLYSRRQLAARVGCHPKTIARAERKGELTAVRFNTRLVRYRAVEVERWITLAARLRP